MKPFEKYFNPYAQYCLRTAFSEEKLKEVIAKEFPSPNNLSAGIKAAFTQQKITFFKTSKPLVLHPVSMSRNTLRGNVLIQCENTPAPDETILHITILPPQNFKWFPYVWCGFALLWGIASLQVMWWGILISLMGIGFFFMAIELKYRMALSEVPQIRKTFETQLRELEKKYKEIPR